MPYGALQRFGCTRDAQLYSCAVGLWQLAFRRIILIFTVIRKHPKRSPSTARKHFDARRSQCPN